MTGDVSIIAHIGIIEVGDQLLVIIERRRIDGSEACHSVQTGYTDLS